jgi:hypothetical protein
VHAATTEGCSPPLLRSCFSDWRCVGQAEGDKKVAESREEEEARKQRVKKFNDKQLAKMGKAEVGAGGQQAAQEGGDEDDY